MELEMQKQHSLLKFQSKYCPGDNETWKPSVCGSAGVLGQFNEQNMECMGVCFMLKIKTWVTYE